VLIDGPAHGDNPPVPHRFHPRRLCHGICPGGGPADLPGVIGRIVLTILRPDRRAILDNVVDGYPPIVAGLKGDIDQIEASVFSGAFAQFGCL
jgi:hypothetical protein